MRRRAVFRGLLAFGVLMSTLPYGVPVYQDRLALAASLRHQSMAERRATLFAPWYGQAVALRDALAGDSAVDFVMVKPSARDIAVLAGAILQPHDVRFFDGWESWRARRRAAFLLDARAANAAPGPPPPRAPVVVVVDPEATPQFRVVAPPR